MALEIEPGVGGVDDVGALRGVGDPQRDPQVGVGPDLGRHHAAGPLGGQDQVDAERAAALGDVDQAGDEVGQLARQRGELVDHDEQPRHGVELRTVRPQVDVVLDVLGARVGEQVLAAGQLGAERDQRALDEVGVEVGDHADGVRQVDAVLERGAALVVDEHEGHAVGPVGHRERRDERLQQLGLAGAGGAGDQPVRAVAAHVDGERAVERDADDGLGRARLHRPAGHDRLGPDRLELHHLGEAAGRGQDRVVVAAGDVAQRRQGARDPLQPGLLDEVGGDVLDDGDALLAQRQPGDGLDDDRGRLLGQQPLVGVEAQIE